MKLLAVKGNLACQGHSKSCLFLARRNKSFPTKLVIKPFLATIVQKKKKKKKEKKKKTKQKESVIPDLIDCMIHRIIELHANSQLF